MTRRTASETRCGFCRTEISPDREVFGIPAKARPEIDIERHRGEELEVSFDSLGRTITVIVAGRDSPAVQAGYDLYFAACSEACARALKAAIQEDQEHGGPPPK